MFWQRLFGLKNKLYIISFGTLYSLLIIFVCLVSLPSGLSIFTFVVMMIISILNIFAFPWVRIALVGDVDHPMHFAMDNIKGVYKDVRNRAYNAKQAYDNTPVDRYEERIYDEYGNVLSVKGYESTRRKEDAKYREWTKINDDMGKRTLKLILKFFLGIFIWIATPILIWFLLNNNTFEKAARKGYLKDKFYIRN